MTDVSADSRTPKCIWLINQYASTPDTGMGGRTFYLARELSELGYTVCMISAHYNHKLRVSCRPSMLRAMDYRYGFLHLRFRVIEYASSSSPARILNWIIFTGYLRWLLPNQLPRPDAVIYSSPALPGFEGIRRVARRMRAKLVFEVRDIWPLTLMNVGKLGPNNPLVRVLQYIEDRAYSEADLVVSNLKFADRHMQSRKMAPEKFRWIPNGYTERDGESERLAEAPPLIALPGEQFVVGYAGAIGLANGLDALLDAAELLRGEGVQIVLVGAGRERERLSKRVENEALTNVMLLPSVPKAAVPGLLAQFDACYLGLAPEPVFEFGISPNKLFDYLRAAKPIIYAVDSGDYRPVSDCGAGMEVAAGDAPAIASAIRSLKSRSRSELIRMGERGRKFVEQQHEYRVLAERYARCLFEADA